MIKAVLLAIVLSPTLVWGNPGRSQATIVGEWTGGTNVTGEWMTIQARFYERAGQLEGNITAFSEAPLGFDFPSLNNTPLKNYHAGPDALGFEIPTPSGSFRFEGELKGLVISGTITGGPRTGKFHLLRVRSLDTYRSNEFLGVFNVGQGRFGVTWREFGGLRLIDLESGRAKALMPISDNTFCTTESILTAPDAIEKVTFLKNSKGKVVGFMWEQANGLKASGKKISVFEQEQVRFRNGDVSLSGTLLIPSKKGRHPAVVFVHGYGPIYRTALFERAAHLAQMGVAALVYDKRGTGQSSGEWQMSRTSFDELAGDALAGIQLLQKRTDIAGKRIGLHGHSQAGDVIPIAAANSSDVAFIIVASGGGVKMEESVLFEKRNDLIRSKRFSETDIQQAIHLMRRVHDYVIRGEGDRRQLEVDYMNAQRQPWFPITDLPRLRALPPQDAPEMAYSRKEIGFDPQPFIEKITVPVLVLLGDSDETVPVELAAAGWREGLEKARNKDFTIKIIRGADHGLRSISANGQRIMSPEYWNTITAWLRKRHIAQ